MYETTALVFDYLIKRPRIKVSIYDINTEQLLVKSNPSRNAVVNYEPANIDFIQPIISNHCTLKDSKYSKLSPFFLSSPELLIFFSFFFLPF